MWGRHAAPLVCANDRLVLWITLWRTPRETKKDGVFNFWLLFINFPDSPMVMIDMFSLLFRLYPSLPESNPSTKFLLCNDACPWWSRCFVGCRNQSGHYSRDRFSSTFSCRFTCWCLIPTLRHMCRQFGFTCSTSFAVNKSEHRTRRSSEMSPYVCSWEEGIRGWTS